MVLSPRPPAPAGRADGAACQGFGSRRTEQVAVGITFMTPIKCPENLIAPQPGNTEPWSDLPCAGVFRSAGRKPHQNHNPDLDTAPPT